MAKRLSRIYGTEEDKVNCSFYFKIGACRHGDKCTRLHHRPALSPTLLIPHMYENPPIAIAIAEGQEVPQDQAKEAYEHFEGFYEDVFQELSNYGELAELNICDNVGDHLKGNVYVKYAHEDYAAAAVKALSGRYYSGKPLMPEFSPVTDFREAVCRQFQENQCTRGGFCNFMHLKHISRSFNKQLFKEMMESHPEYKENRRKRRRSRSRDRHRKSSRRSGSRRYGRSRRNRSRSRSLSEGVRKMMNSEERRKQIEQWNDEITDEEKDKKDDKKEEEGDKKPDTGGQPGQLSVDAQRILSQFCFSIEQIQQKQNQQKQQQTEEKQTTK